MSLPVKPTAANVRAYRDANECSLQTAKYELETKWRRECLRQLRSRSEELYTVEACRDVIVDLFDLLIVLEHEQ